MNKNFKLQVPINNNIKVLAEKKALSNGFSSLQEVMRVFLYKYAKNELQIKFENNLTVDKYKVDLEKKVKDIYQKYKQGKRKGYKNTKDLIASIYK